MIQFTQNEAEVTGRLIAWMGYIMRESTSMNTTSRLVLKTAEGHQVLAVWTVTVQSSRAGQKAHLNFDLSPKCFYDLWAPFSPEVMSAAEDFVNRVSNAAVTAMRIHLQSPAKVEVAS